MENVKKLKETISQFDSVAEYKTFRKGIFSIKCIEVFLKAFEVVSCDLL